MQDDWKLSERLTVNLGLRYEVYVPDTEKENRLPNYDPEGMRLVYAGENGTDAPREQGDPLGQPRAAPRRRLGRDRRTRRTWCAPATAGATSRCPYAAGNLLDQNVPDSISQNYSVETNPLVYTPDRVPRLSNPFPPIVPREAAGRRPSSTRPTRSCSATRSRTRRRTWTPGR